MSRANCPSGRPVPTSPHGRQRTAPHAAPVAPSSSVSRSSPTRRRLRRGARFALRRRACPRQSGRARERGRGLPRHVGRTGDPRTHRPLATRPFAPPGQLRHGCRAHRPPPRLPRDPAGNAEQGRRALGCAQGGHRGGPADEVQRDRWRRSHHLPGRVLDPPVHGSPDSAARLAKLVNGSIHPLTEADLTESQRYRVRDFRQGLPKNAEPPTFTLLKSGIVQVECRVPAKAGQGSSRRTRSS